MSIMLLLSTILFAGDTSDTALDPSLSTDDAATEILEDPCVSVNGLSIIPELNAPHMRANGLSFLKTPKGKHYLWLRFLTCGIEDHEEWNGMRLVGSVQVAETGRVVSFAQSVSRQPIFDGASTTGVELLYRLEEEEFAAIREAKVEIVLNLEKLDGTSTVGTTFEVKKESAR